MTGYVVVVFSFILLPYCFYEHSSERKVGFSEIRESGNEFLIDHSRGAPEFR